MEMLLNILNGVRPDVDFLHAEKLIDDHVLDSFDIIRIVNELNDTYDIEINVMDLEPCNFNSAQAIYNLIERLKDE